ncbi:stimulated by retinoic acid gene 6 protein-like isoform X2 [Montipora capricornis]|uniref:stimulated by retinoic acid gene 6 protein-like isoform X2 n=1 Tax=Montipora capricornis TaxID=246305 RepID=UPI0035F14DF9
MSNTSEISEGCKEVLNAWLFDLGCLAPALAIIFILAILERRKAFKLEFFDGRPGLPVPVNFFSKHNRYTIAITFGATAITCTTLFARAFLRFDIHREIIPWSTSPWLKVVEGLILVLLYGILFYPFFACLTTDHRLIGAVMGFIYGAIRFSFGFGINFQCGSSFNKNGILLVLLPTLTTNLCLLFIVIRFAVVIFLEGRKRWFHSTNDIDRHGQPRVMTGLARESGIKYVKLALNPGSNIVEREVKWYTKAVQCVYKTRDDFEFSTQLISTVMVAMIVVVQLSIASFIVLQILADHLRSQCPWATCEESFRILYDSELAGTALSAVISVLSLLHFMKCHRDHVLQLFQGKRTFAQNVTVTPVKALRTSLRFSGYQIAFTTAGFVVMSLFLTLIFIILGVESLRVIVWKYIIIPFIPAIVMSLIVLILQVLLAHFVFRNRDFPKIVITVDNRRLFSIVSFFLFFQNILVGIFSFFSRLLKGMALGFFFLSRVDRTCLMHGFQNFDQGFVAYLGFLDLLVAHSHPMMLVFCQLLINRNKERGLIESTASEETGTAATVYPRRLGIPRVSHKAINRWFVAVTLTRNPSLIQYRRQECRGAKTVVHVESINVDFNDLVHTVDEVLSTAQ